MARAASWQEVQSTAIKRVRHLPEVNKLQVEFHGREDLPAAVAEYDDVSAEKYAALLRAPSIGKHFHAHIKAKHRWRYVG